MAKLKCPKCEFTAGRIQGLSRHLGHAHGIKDKAERAVLLGGAPAARSKAKKPTGGGTRRSGQGPAARSAAPLVAKFAFPGLVAHLDTEILSTQARLDKLKELRQSAVELGA